jgi:membrane protein
LHIPGFRGLGPFTVIKEAIQDFLDDDMETHAAALAYQVLFSLFPFIIFLIALLGFLNLSDFFAWLQQQAAAVFPDQAMDQVNRVINELQKPQGGLLSAGAIIALWTASVGTRTVMHALNVAYNVKESRPIWKRFPLSILYTIGIAAMMIIAATLLVIGPEAIQWLAERVGLEQLFVILWTWLRWPVILLLLITAVTLVYYVAPNVEQEFRFITPGAVISVIAWIAASLGFDFYVRNFADYSVMYGSIATIMVLLLYFFISAAVLLFGAEVNSVIEHHAPAGKAQGQKTLRQVH